METGNSGWQQYASEAGAAVSLFIRGAYFQSATIRSQVY